MWGIGTYSILNDDHLEMRMLHAEILKKALDGITLAIIFSRSVLANDHLKTGGDDYFLIRMNIHQAGFGAADFDHWVSLGRTNPRFASELWFIRQYAADQQEPLMQHEIFLRFNWQDIIPSKLNAGVMMIISPYDGSVLAQASAQYFLTRNWTVGLYLGEVMGSADTVVGSLPWSTSGVVQIVRYL